MGNKKKWGDEIIPLLVGLRVAGFYFLLAYINLKILVQTRASIQGGLMLFFIEFIIKHREKVEDEINEWIDKNVFNDKLNTFLSIKV